MDEVDNIILHSLRQLGVDIPPDTEKLVEFPDSLVFLAVSKCLQTILPNSDVPKNLSTGMSQKYQIASRLAAICKELGYKGDMGYQTFLYPDENDLRRVLMYLIERLPKEFDKIDEIQSTDDLSVLIMNIRKKIEHDLNDVWVPPYCRNKSFASNNKGGILHNGCSYINTNSRTCFPATKGSTNVKDEITTYTKAIHGDENLLQHANDFRVKEIVEKFASLKVEQPIHPRNKSDTMSGNIINESSEKLATDSQSVDAMPMPKDTSTHTELSEEKKMAVIQMKHNLFVLKEDICLLENEIQQLKQNISKLAALKAQRIVDVQGFMKSASLFNNSLDELPITEDQMRDINKSVEEIESRISNLVKEWDEHRIPVEIEIQMVEQTRSENQSLSSKKLNEIENNMIKYEEVKKELSNKQNLYSQQIVEYTSLSKNIKSRSGYTRKIMEIIGNISKQKKEIEKILSDTRIMQKEINNLNGQLDRSFTLADEMIFKDVKKDEHSKKIYKLLATLHTVCGEITTMVKETGVCLRDIRDQEEHIEAERGKNMKETLDKISADLKQTQVEAQLLQTKIKDKFDEHSTQK